MARSTFGGTAADFLYDRGPANVLQSVTGSVTFWSAPEEGRQHTDLLIDGAPASVVPVNAQGQLPVFQGPNGVATMWADAGAGWRVRVLGDAVGTVQAAQAAADAAETALAAAEAIADDVAEISGLSGEDAAVGALIAGTGGAGALTRAALRDTFSYLPPSNGTDDAAALNAAVAGGGAFKAIPGQAYKLGAQLVLDSDTHFDVAGATFTGAAGWTGSNMITNRAAVTHQRAVTDAVLNSGSKTLTSATAAFTTGDIGRTVVVDIGNPGSITVFTATIVARTNGTTVTLDRAAGASITGGSMKIYDRDRNIVVTGAGSGLIQRGNVSAPADDNRQHTLLFRRVDGLRISGLRADIEDGKYAISLGDVTNYDVADVEFVDTNSDGVHITGPASNGRIANLTGATADDFVAVGCSDYVNYADVQGDITDLTLENLQPTSCVRIFHIFGGSTGNAFQLKNITARGLRGASSQAPVLLEQGDASGHNTVVDNISVDGLDAVEGNGGPSVLIGSAGGTSTFMGNLRLANIRKAGSTESTDIIRVVDGLTVRRLDVDGIQIPDGPPTAGVVKVEGKVNSLTLTRVDAVLGTAGRLVTLDAASVDDLVVDRANVAGKTNSSGPFLVLCTGANTGRIAIRNYKGVNFDGNYPLELNGTITLDLFSVDFGTCYQVILMDGGSTTVRVRGSGIDFAHTSDHPADGDAGAKCYSSTFDFKVDLSKAAVGTSALGDRCTNTNAGLACGAGPVVRTASAWKSLLTGATY